MATHRRKSTATNALSLAMDTGPTSTTKALLISVIAPRKFFTRTVVDSSTNTSEHNKEADTTVTIETITTTQERLQEVVQQNKNNAEVVASITQDKKNKKKSKKNSFDSDLSKETETSDTNTSNDYNETDTNPSDHNTTYNEDDDEHQVTAEEAAAVVPTENDEKEVNMEELLRITMQALLEEWHLLNIPTYSDVLDKQSIVSKISLHTLFSNQSLRVREVKSFIRMDVMARPPSLGVIMERLERIGLGVEVGTVSIYKAELCKTASPYAHLPPEPDDDDDNKAGGLTEEDDTLEPSNHDSSNRTEEEEKEQERLKEERMIAEAKMEWKNAATRLRIEQVREQIVEQAAFTFDFIALLTVASILAGIGLITNNTVVIVASMLVSPIMGPVLGLTFGSRIKDWPLVKTSLLHEVYALLGCVVIGVLVGIAAGFTPLATENWPTNEMQSRGEWTGLLTGIAVAIPSGMGVCLSILGGNTSSLVGVAISASLLPPAVNAGICFLYSILLKTDAVMPDSGLSAGEFALIGGISFALTAINILCIWASGIVMFEIKEVAPTKEKSAFWAKDIKEAREMNTHRESKTVNVSVLRKGLKAALRKQSDTDKPVDTIKIVPPKQQPHPTESVGSAFALQHTTHPAVKSFTALTEEEVTKDDNVRYVGLEDMASLLGFDQEDEEDEIDHAAVAKRIGRGRYL